MKNVSTVSAETIGLHEKTGYNHEEYKNFTMHNNKLLVLNLYSSTWPIPR